LLGWQGRADPQGGQRSGAAEGSGGPELEPESIGGGGSQFGQRATGSVVIITVGGPAGTAVGWDQQQHDPVVAEVIRQGGGERTVGKAPGREQQAAQERPLGRAGQQQVLVSAGTVGVGQLDGHA
jgi:hypothetical protein